MASVAIMWFRRDLRLADNPALLAALDHADEVLPVFIDDQALRGPSGVNRLWFLHGCLAELADSTDGALVVRSSAPADALVELVGEIEADAVFCAADFAPYGQARDEAVRAALDGAGAELIEVGSSYAVPPGSVFTKSDTPFRVFTPFSKGWRAHGWDEPVDAPSRPRWRTGVRGDGLPAAPEVTADLPPPGEAAALERLEEFLADGVSRYADDRNRPDIDSTSRLSPYLKWGSVHPRQILDRLGRGKGAEVLASELAWREFYADVLFHAPDSARAALNEDMAGIELDEGPEADERFDAWRDGRTGFPIVDAGMRQLVATGWMHNRVRMIVASFLVKDLHIDWTRGARHFMEHLVDGDLASNQHGWQWVAGTGTDAAPYFRVFNPTSQSKRFDPNGDYIRRWVPELAGLEGDDVHEPPTSGDLFSDGAGDYPAPIVDHATERDEALRRWRAATGRD